MYVNEDLQSRDYKETKEREREFMINAKPWIMD